MAAFPISAPNAGLQQQPSVGLMVGGLFVVAWADTAGGTIRAAVFGADGRPASDAAPASGPAQANLVRRRPAACLTGSGFAVAWIEQALNPPGPPPAIKVQRFDTSARKLGPEIEVAVDEVDTDQALSIGRLIDGGFAIAWAGTRADRRVLMRRFDVDGRPRGEAARVSDEEGRHERPLVAVLADGNIVVAWTRGPAPGGGNAALRLFDHQGMPLGPVLTPNIFGAHAMAMVAGGGFAIAHFRGGPDSDIGEPTNSLRVNVFDAGGRMNEVPIFPPSERTVFCSSPALAPLPGHRLVVAWLQKSSLTVAARTHLHAAVFDSATTASLGAPLQVDAATEGERFRAGVAALPATGERGAAAFFAWDDNASGAGGGPPRMDVFGRAIALSADGGLEG